MKNAICYLVFLMAQHSLYAETGRFQRDLLNFESMIRKVTRRNPLDFNGYGCYCGAGGHGKPVDLLDRCCQLHDRCYAKLQKERICGRLGIYFSSYKTISTLKCNKARNTRCGNGLCECDKAAAICFKRSPFNHLYKNYNKNRCNNKTA